jgi:hypothetical protein
MRRFLLPAVVVLVGSLATLAGLVAQSNVGQLHGKVTDTSGAVLPGTDVQIRRPAGGERRTVTDYTATGPSSFAWLAWLRACAEFMQPATSEVARRGART